jgi:hypothetical protein
MLLIQFGFTQAEDIRGNISFLFENVTKLQSLFVNGNSIYVGKFTPSSVRGFWENKVSPK